MATRALNRPHVSVMKNRYPSSPLAFLPRQRLRPGPLPVVLASALLLAFAFAPTSLVAQVEEQVEEQVKERKETETKPAAPEWPELDEQDQARGEKLLNNLRKERQDVREKAADELVALGLGMANRMFRRMTDSKHYNINTELAAVLDRILAPAHAPLIALHAGHKSLFARRYVFKKLATFGAPSSVEVFAAALEDKDPEIRYYAALGHVKTSAETGALDLVFERCLKDWALLGDEFARFMAGERSPRFVPWLRKKLASEDSHERVTALRMMRSLAPKESATIVRRFLDSEASIEKKEAINTLRVVVDGNEPMPLKKITVFRVIKMAKEWKARL